MTTPPVDEHVLRSLKLLKDFQRATVNVVYDNFFKNTINYNNDVSLVDEIIKGMIEDANLKIDFLISFDKTLNNYANAQGIRTV